MRLIIIGEYHGVESSSGQSLADFIAGQDPFGFVNEYSPNHRAALPVHHRLHTALRQKGVQIVQGGWQDEVRFVHSDPRRSLPNIYAPIPSAEFPQVLAEYKLEYRTRTSPYVPAGNFMSTLLATKADRGLLYDLTRRFHGVKHLVKVAATQQDLKCALVIHRDLLLALLVHDMRMQARNHSKKTIVVLRGDAHVHSLDWILGSLGFEPSSDADTWRRTVHTSVHPSDVRDQGHIDAAHAADALIALATRAPGAVDPGADPGADSGANHTGRGRRRSRPRRRRRRRAPRRDPRTGRFIPS